MSDDLAVVREALREAVFVGQTVSGCGTLTRKALSALSRLEAREPKPPIELPGGSTLKFEYAVQPPQPVECHAPYSVTLHRDEDGDWIARVPELMGCASHGKTQEEAIQRVREVQALWLDDARSAGEHIPSPITAEQLPSVGRAPQPVECPARKALEELYETLAQVDVFAKIGPRIAGDLWELVKASVATPCPPCPRCAGMLRCSKGHIHNQKYGSPCPMCERYSLREKLSSAQEQIEHLHGLELQLRDLVRMYTAEGVQQREENASLREKVDQAESILASCTDLANSWARESGVLEAKDEAGLRDLIDRLWSAWSSRYYEQQVKLAAIREKVERLVEALRPFGIPEWGPIFQCAASLLAEHDKEQKA